MLTPALAHDEIAHDTHGAAIDRPAYRMRDGNGSLLGSIYRLPLECDEPQLKRWVGELTANELQRAGRFHFDRDRRRYIAGRAQLRRLIAARLSVPRKQIEFFEGRFGKPELAPPLSIAGLQFNLSNTEDLAVVAMTTRRRVGVDIEAIRAVEDEARLAERNFSSSEHEGYRTARTEHRTEAFFRCWTRKEAFIKADGAGMSRALQSFDVTIGPDHEARIVRFGELPGETCGWGLGGFVPAEGYVAAVAVEGVVGTVFIHATEPALARIAHE